MSQDAARRLLDLVLRHSAEQDQVLADIEAFCTPQEFQRYKQMVGQSMGSMLLDVINPIVEMYPELKPSRLE